MNTRRTLLKTGLVAGAAVVTGVVYFDSKRTETRAIARQLTFFLDHADQASLLGSGLLKTDPELHGHSLTQMTDLLLAGLGLNREQFFTLSRNALLDRLHSSVHTDFIEENIVMISGWVLSRTEAQLCSLLYLLRN